MIHKKRIKKALKVLKRARGAVFIVAAGIRYPVNKKAVAQMRAERLPANTVTRKALEILDEKLGHLRLRSPHYSMPPFCYTAKDLKPSEIKLGQPPLTFTKEGAD